MKSGKENQANKGVKKLIGWLVSYQNNDRGCYYELRSGKVFVGGGVIEGERVISLDNKEFSTPHAVLSASTDHTLVVQDVFSDSGTFFRRSGTADEIEVHGPVSLEHGDWIRFGDTLRFQVCIADGGSR